jgi:1-acyl-sn-glycerol-3-phosphate acyltransferase
MRPYYRFAYTIVGLELRLHRIRIEGRENIPAEGCLIISNHVSFMDPTTVGWAIAREIYFLGRKSLFKPPFWNWFLPICNVLPIDREGNDISGLRRIIKKLQGGDSVLLFPEGTRSRDGQLQPAEPGAALIAIKAGVSILPTRVFGTYESLSRQSKRLRFHPIRVVIGRPYRPSLPAGRPSKETYRLVAQEMMDHITALH